MRKPCRILTLTALISIVCLTLSPCAGKCDGGAAAQSTYAGTIRDADVFIDMPNLRQYGSYTCGTTCVQMLMNWLHPYRADLNLAVYEEELGTSDDAGTSPDSLVDFFESNDVNAIATDKRTTDELIHALN